MFYILGICDLPGGLALLNAAGDAFVAAPREVRPKPKAPQPEQLPNVSMNTQPS